MSQDQTKPKGHFELSQNIRELVSQPVDYSPTLDRICTLVRHNRIAEALQALEAFRREINDSVAQLFQIISREEKTIHDQEITIQELRLQVIEGALHYAELNKDSDG